MSSTSERFYERYNRQLETNPSTLSYHRPGHRRHSDGYDELVASLRGIHALRDRSPSESSYSSQETVIYVGEEAVGEEAVGEDDVGEEGEEEEDAMAANNLFPNLEARQAPSPTSSHAGSQMNGNGIPAAGYMAPLPVGHQQDLNYLYTQIQELSGILRRNREKVEVITKTAEEVARQANGGRRDGQGSTENDAARIRELELALARAKRTIELYKHEQVENTKLIAEWEDAMGTATEQIRNYCCDNTDRYLAQRRHYNDLLQAEKDEHLQSRLERDACQAEAERYRGMIMHAYRLRCDEWGRELTIISGLQNEVRVYRNALGMERERPEDETGWSYLRQAPLNLEGIDET